MNKLHTILILFFLSYGCSQNKKIETTNEQMIDTIVNFHNSEQIKKDSIAALEKARYDEYVKEIGFETVAIGNQIWTKFNLNVSTFMNGDSIPQAITNEEWKEAGRLQKPAWCYFNNDPNNGESVYYGKLYNYWAVIDKRGLAPKGFHIPNEYEWKIFLKFIGHDRYEQSSTTAGNKLISETGFNALLGGLRYDFGTFIDIEKDHKMWKGGYWWTSSHSECLNPPCNDLYPKYVHLDNDYQTKGPYSYAYNQNSGMTVRCIKGVLDSVGTKKQAEKELAADFAIAKTQYEYTREQEAKENEKKSNKSYLSDGSKCTNCGLGNYSRGSCSQCGAVSRERLNESLSKRPNCEGCNGSGYFSGYNGKRLCPGCKGSGKQTY